MVYGGVSNNGSSGFNCGVLPVRGGYGDRRPTVCYSVHSGVCNKFSGTTVPEVRRSILYGIGGCYWYVVYYFCCDYCSREGRYRRLESDRQRAARGSGHRRRCYRGVHRYPRFQARHWPLSGFGGIV